MATVIEDKNIFDVLVKYLSQFGNISESEIQKMSEMINFKSFIKDSYLVKEGQIANKCYFVLKGLVRQFYVIDGEEKTTNFYLEGEPVTTTFSNDTNPVDFNLVCSEDSLIIEGNPGDEVAFFEALPQFIPFNALAIETETKKIHNDLIKFKILSPEERYLKLMNERPELFDRVPLYQLASYLGIKPESLSRIRKRIMKKG